MRAPAHARDRSRASKRAADVHRRAETPRSTVPRAERMSSRLFLRAARSVRAAWTLWRRRRRWRRASAAWYAAPRVVIEEVTDSSSAAAGRARGRDAATDAEDDAVVFVRETASEARGDAIERARDAIARLGWRVVGTRADGNCCFRSLARGARRLARGKTRGTRNARGGGFWDGDGSFTHARVREAICDGIERAREATSSGSEARRRLHELVLHGEEGRRYLRTGKLKRASDEERLDVYLRTMRRDASKCVGTSEWPRYWGSDAEIAVFACLARVCVVVLETARTNGGESHSFCIAVPDLDEDDTAAHATRFYASGVVSADEGGRATITWRSSRRDVAYTVRTLDAKTARKKLRARHTTTDGARVLPVIAVRHQPAHFDALAPVRSTDALVCEIRRRVDAHPPPHRRDAR